MPLGVPSNNLWISKLQTKGPPISLILSVAQIATVAYTESAISVDRYQFSGPGVGALFLAPWQADSLALVLSGLDSVGQQQIFTQFPYRTGQEVRTFS